MACLGPCPSGKEGEKVTCPKGKSTCPGRPDGGFFDPAVLRGPTSSSRMPVTGFY